MKTSFQIIGIAWAFYKKQPVLNQIAFWLFFVPVGVLDALSGVVDTVAAQDITVSAETLESMTAMEIAVTIPIILGLIYLMMWGHACTLMVSKRLLTSSAGRTRSSFKAVRDQAKKFVIPLFLVSLLRTITTLLWALLLVVPGVIYSIRTVFFDIMTIEKGKVIYGREMLNKSKEVVKGHTWEVLGKILVISICIFVPAMLLSVSLEYGLEAIDTRLETLGVVLIDAIDAYTGMFFIVCMVALYSEMKKLSPSK